MVRDIIAKIVFTLSSLGSSTSIPHIECLTVDESVSSPKCSVCFDAYNNPLTSPNKRRNTSTLLRYTTSNSTTSLRNILIDCGKTFNDSAISFLVPHKIRKLEACLLTHPHADAVFGLDDLRAWNAIQGNLDVYCSKETLPTVTCAFPYLVDAKKATGGGAVSRLNFKVFDEESDNMVVKPFQIGDLTIQPIKVVHGEQPDGSPFYCMGFRFDDILYLSDISAVPEESFPLMIGSEIMIVDTLKDEGYYKSHFSLDQSLDLIFKIKPKNVFLVGMGHKLEYYKTNQKLEQYKASRGIDVQLARDGLKIVFE